MEYKDFKIKILPLTCLEKDPLNEEAYLDTDVSNLAESMKDIGFFGDLVAYPIEGEKYRIESGHRRYDAAMLADITEVPVFITEPPKNLVERRKRLNQWNDYARPTTPLGTAKLIDFKYHTYKMENDYLKKIGKNTFPILERISKEMNISIAHISKMRALLKLNPKMQSLAESGNYSWAILSQASQLNDFQQNMLYRKITMQGSIQSAVSGNWIKDEIDKAKCIKKDYVYSVYREEKPDYPEVKEKTKFRHKDGYKRIEKSYDFLKSAFEDDSIIKANRLEDCLSILIEMQDDLNDYIAEIKKKIE